MGGTVGINTDGSEMYLPIHKACLDMTKRFHQYQSIPALPVFLISLTFSYRDCLRYLHDLSPDVKSKWWISTIFYSGTGMEQPTRNNTVRSIPDKTTTTLLKTLLFFFFFGDRKLKNKNKK
ncbi:hypothetical protein F4811DRAFT_533941 [Daldinia bambusicola]|nr:hypothetical protein F4811DRAFT_533941 [Daldinia bambusicola]